MLFCPWCMVCCYYLFTSWFFQLCFYACFFVGFFLRVLMYGSVVSLTCCMAVCQHIYCSVTFADSHRLEYIRPKVWSVFYSRSSLSFNTWQVCMYVGVLDCLKVHTLYNRNRRPDVIFLVNGYYVFKFFTSLLELDGLLVQTCKVTGFI